MTAEATVNSIIANALSVASTEQAKADGYGQTALMSGFPIDRFPNTALGEGRNALNKGQGATLFDGVTPNIVRPTFLNVDPYSTFVADWDAEATKLSTQLSGLFSTFLTTYFPKSSAATLAAEQWLLDTITNGATGIPVNVESQIWERSRSREIIESQRVTDEAMATFSARGFSLPPGALAGKIWEIQQAVADKVSTHGRDVAIKQVEVQIETMKFAIAQTLDYRIKAINSALEYWKAYLLPEEIAARRFTVLAQQKLAFYNAAVELYRADTQLYASTVQNRQVEIDASMKAASNYTEMARTAGTNMINAAVAAAQTAGSMASASLGTLNTMSQLANITTVSA